ncbi:response regulator [Burkholderia thailandensis MSMB121]|uniref:HD domain-containing phosphohydrolase n=1 Tax=Burkholderia humptydooensis TaxID=430531 RepID=UPI000327FA60|nr:HD domain-containing phosphohydrolase [Burkholderia humptydooensis]AGK49651.1 response regulator [Burkholderia thailandensis MSMB121]ATF32597.1 two-component system response regulator [Burkholderia thailandensis]KST71216.1 two-component system response regulator [Burkholderia humptydooensis]
MIEHEKVTNPFIPVNDGGADIVNGAPATFAEHEASASAPAPTVLLVDDELGVLSSLRRLFRTTRYQVLTADSAAAALDILACNTVDVIISDMRMPYMNGADFLARARTLYPDTTRILLTGYSEIDLAVRAINEGAVYRYLTKPWDDREVLLAVDEAIEQQRLRRENARLGEVASRQNEALRTFNTALEVQVHARTEELRQTVMFLDDAQSDLKHNFTAMVQVCANMIELRCGVMGGESLRIGEAARSFALAFGMSGLQAQELFFAGLLHGIGKLSLPDELLRKPLDRMSAEESQLYYQHALRAQMVLTPVQQLQSVAHIIRHQYERFNGRGTPDGLAGEEIPFGSRLLAVARDFEALRGGSMVSQPFTAEQALRMLVSQSGMRYDPAIVEQFVALSKDPSALAGPGAVSQVNASQLREGMRLAGDLRTNGGILLVTRGSVVSSHQVAQLRRFEAQEAAPFEIVIHESAGAVPQRNV